MRTGFVQLNRTFIPYDPNQAPEEAAVQSYLSEYSRTPSTRTWEKLLEHGRGVILGEPGSGKTWEFEAQVQRLCAEGKPAFFLPLEMLVGQTVEELLDGDHRARFFTWKSGAENAFFLLDARDEAQIKDYHGFELAVRGLANSLGPAKDRAHLLFSSRIFEWRGAADEDLLIRYFPLPDKRQQTTRKNERSRRLSRRSGADDADRFLADHMSTNGDEKEPRRLLVVKLAPLSQAQVCQLAEARIEEADAFVNAIDNRDAWAFARRPLDVEGLIEYWRENGDLGSLAQLLEFDIMRKLDETNARRGNLDPLTRQGVREGANALAIATIFCRRLNFSRPHEKAGVPVQADTIDPRSALPGWKSSEIIALLTRPVFDTATFGHVRFHHRETTEYMAGDCLRSLHLANLPFTKLRDLLIRTSHDHRVIPPSRKPVAAWVSMWLPEMRREILTVDPEILLEHGDPSGLSLTERICLLENIANRHVARLGNFDVSQLRRLAHPDLSQTINLLALDSDTHEDVRELMLELARYGRLHQCAEAALRIATNPFEPLRLRLDATWTLKETGNQRQLRLLADQALRRSTLATREAGMICRAIYPDVIDEDELGLLLHLAEVPTRLSVGWLDDTIEETIESLPLNRLAALVNLLVRLSLERPWGAAHDGGGPSQVSARFWWVYEPLLTAIRKILKDADHAGLTPGQVVEAIERLSLLREYNPDHRIRERKLQEDLADHPDVRRHLFWSGVTRIRQSKEDDKIWSFTIADDDALWQPAEWDIEWLLVDTTTARSEADRILALRIAIDVWRHETNQSAGLRNQIYHVARREPILRRAYAREMPTSIKQRWAWVQRRFHLLRHRGWQYKFKRGFWRGRDYFRVLWQCIRHFRSLQRDGPFWLLQNLTIVARESPQRNRYGDFDIDEIARLYGPVIGAAARRGFKASWKSWRSPLRGNDLNTTYNPTIISLIGLEVAVRDGLDMASLPEEEAETAAHHALYELNGFPSWIYDLAVSHPNVVRQVLQQQLTAEFAFPADQEHPYGVLHDLLYRGEPLWPLCTPDVMDLLRAADPANLVILSLALELLAKSNAVHREQLKVLSPVRVAVAAATGDEAHLIRWLSLWLHIDAIPALDYLENQLGTDAVHPEEFIVSLASALRGERRGGLAIPDPDFLKLSALRRLVPLLYRYVRQEDDLRHDGEVHSLSERDDAQAFRSAALSWVIETPDESGYDALVELADDPALVHLRDRLLGYAVERANQDAEDRPWRSEEVAAYIDRFERLPDNPDELFELVMGRLDDIRDDSENGDFSLNCMFKENTKEEVFQKWLAGWLDEASKETYQVAREMEVVDYKMPDIRIFRAGVGIVTIEVKVANKWSFTELCQKALENQLVGQYMRVRRSRHGILLLVNLKRDRTWQPTGEPRLGFTELVKRLQREASDMARARRRGEKIDVVGIDLS